MKNSKQLLTAIFLLGTAAMMTACGSSRTAGSSDLSSTSGVTSTTDAANKSVAICNQGSSSSMGAKLKVFTNTAGNIDMNYMWVRLTTLPSGFASNSSYISFYKWLGNSSGSTYLDSTKLSMVLRDSTTGNYITTTWSDTLKWSDVSTTAQSLGIYDAQTFFNRVDILVYLNDAQGQYDVLKIANYSTSGSSASAQLDVLLPPFSANPAAYATEADGSTRNSALQGLHPFRSMANQGWTTAQFLSMSQSYCF